LIDAHESADRVLVYYLMLPTELHVLSQVPPGDTVGRLARAVGNIVSRWVRESQPVRSPVLAGPFRAHRIESAAELRNDARMLAWRPVYQGLCRTPNHYAHGGLRIALGLTPAQGFDARYLLQEFGDPVPAARAALRAWVAQRPSDRECRQWELTRGLVLAIEGAGLQTGMAHEVRGAGPAMLVAAGSGGIDGAIHLLETWVVAKLDAHAAPDLRVASAIGSRGRALVGCLAVEHQLCSAASVARYFGRAKATLSEQMAACRKSPSDRAILATPVLRICEEASTLAAVATRKSRP
jgi:hypothetical protein